MAKNKWEHIEEALRGISFGNVFHQKNRNKVALALSGGGARGFAHIGAIGEILDRGFQITQIAGTSMGALVGGMYALGCMNKFEAVATHLTKFQTFRLFNLAYRSAGFTDGEKLFDFLRLEFPAKKIEELEIPYRAVAVDIINREEVCFATGDIYDAIRASISIPTVFTPVKKGGKILVDGGVLNNIPVNHLKKHDDEITISVNVNADIPYASGEPLKRKTIQKIDFVEVVDYSLGLMMDTIARNNLEEHAPDINIRISRDSCEMFDFFKASDQIEYGRVVTRYQLDKIGLKAR